MFDIIGYAMNNDVSLEIIPLRPDPGFRLRMRDMGTAAQESIRILPEEMDDAAYPEEYLEAKCDSLLALIGKRKAVQKQREADQAHRNAIEDFFRHSGNDILEQ